MAIDASALEPDICAELQTRAPDAVIATVAARQHGVVGRKQLMSLGMTRRAIGHRLGTGRLHSVHRGVYAVGHPVLSLRGHWMAAVLASGSGAVLSHRSAAALWNLRQTNRGRIDVTVPRKQRSRPRIEIHRSLLAAGDVSAHDGIPVTTPARTLLDLAAVLPLREVERALEQAEILRIGRDLRPMPGRPGAAVLTRLLDAGRSNPTRSELEERFVTFLATHRIPTPQRNAKIATTEGWLEVDAVWCDQRLIVELDGYATHGTRAAFERDRARDRALQAVGWRVIRITWKQLRDEPRALAAQIRMLLDVRAALG